MLLDYNIFLISSWREWLGKAILVSLFTPKEAKKTTKKNNEGSLEAFVLTPFFPSAFSSLWYAHFLRETAMKESDLYLLKPLMWPCYVYEDFVSTLNRMKREEQNWKKEKVTPCTQKHLQADWNAKWHLLENDTLPCSAHSGDQLDNLSRSTKQKSAETKCLKHQWYH